MVAVGLWGKLTMITLGRGHESRGTSGAPRRNNPLRTRSERFAPRPRLSPGRRCGLDRGIGHDGGIPWLKQGPHQMGQALLEPIVEMTSVSGSNSTPKRRR